MRSSAEALTPVKVAPLPAGPRGVAGKGGMQEPEVESILREINQIYWMLPIMGFGQLSVFGVYAILDGIAAVMLGNRTRGEQHWD